MKRRNGKNETVSVAALMKLIYFIIDHNHEAPGEEVEFDSAWTGLTMKDLVGVNAIILMVTPANKKRSLPLRPYQSTVNSVDGMQAYPHHKQSHNSALDRCVEIMIHLLSSTKIKKSQSTLLVCHSVLQ